MNVILVVISYGSYNVMLIVVIELDNVIMIGYQLCGLKNLSFFVLLLILVFLQFLGWEFNWWVINWKKVVMINVMLLVSVSVVVLVYLILLVVNIEVNMLYSIVVIMKNVVINLNSWVLICMSVLIYGLWG